MPHDLTAAPTYSMDLPPHCIRVLLVEDHADTLEVLTKMLSADGHEVTTAGTIAGALAALEDSDFDLLICDLLLPDGKATDLPNRARQWGGNPSLRCIAVSGLAYPADIQHGLDGGFDEYLVKPLTIQALRAAISRVCDSAPPARGGAS